MGRLSNEVKSQIVALKEANMSNKAISRQLRVPLSTVRSVLKKYAETGSVSNLPVSGRPKKLTQTTVRAICRSVLKSPKNSVALVTAKVNRSSDEAVSSKTVPCAENGQTFQ